MACFLECCLAAASSSGAEGSLRLPGQQLRVACVLNTAAGTIWAFSSSLFALSMSPSPASGQFDRAVGQALGQQL